MGVHASSGINLNELATLPGVKDTLQFFTREKTWINEIHLQCCRVPAPTFMEQERAAWFLEQGLQRVIITLGAEGALLATREKTERIPSCRVDAKDTTGAGDAFIGSFAVFLAEGLPEAEAVALACKYAALSTTKVGTQKSFPSRADFEQRFRAADPT